MPGQFTCARCGIEVVLIVEDHHPENLYCLDCRFIESLDTDEQKEMAAKILDRPREGTES